jgi:predicted membrane-bound dolichyl-phosphate-mannose-protein mannosyltransferase
VKFNKWIKLERGVLGLSRNLVFFDKVNFYIGRSDYWGVAIDVSFYDRSLTFRLLNLYIGVEVWYSDSM